MEKIREACAKVSEMAEHVRLHTDLVPDYTARLLQQYPLTTSLGTDNHFVSADKEETARYVVALDSLNFGSGYFRKARDEGISLGYSVFARSLKQAFLDGEMNTPEKWSMVSPKDFSRMFNIASGMNESVDTLFGLFTRHLRETGERLSGEYQGQAMNLVESANGSAARLAETLAQWPTFRDIAEYKGHEVPILKRAQIMPTDLHLAKVADFRDMAALTAFADNRVPHVLRCDGILSYKNELAGKIDRLEPLVSGSPEEVELRAVSIHAVEFMKAAARKQGHDVTSVNIDHILWGRGSEPAIHQRPTHRTMTSWY